MRVDRPPFTDRRVREAVYKAIDPETIVNTAFGAGWLSIGMPVPQADWLLPEAEISRLYKRDLEGARRLLREAGFENGFDTNLSIRGPIPTYLAGGELIIAQLKEANIRATARVVDSITYTEQVYNRGEFEMEFGPKGNPLSADAFLFSRYHSKGSLNHAKINDPRLDEMIERQTTLGRSPEERKKVLLEIQRYVLEQAYYRSVATNELPIAFQPYVRDFRKAGVLLGEQGHLVQVWLDK
jgi:peptide/nickel transport system substrate-binding protein